MRLSPLSPIRPFQLSSLGTARFEQKRFAEAVALFRESAQLVASFAVYGYLAASYAHLGQTGEAKAALARSRSLFDADIDTWTRVFHKPDHLKLFLDGIAMAEGKMPPDAATSG
jgi:predicted Zn-dependent protease